MDWCRLYWLVHCTSSLPSWHKNILIQLNFMPLKLHTNSSNKVIRIIPMGLYPEDYYPQLFEWLNIFINIFWNNKLNQLILILNKYFTGHTEYIITKFKIELLLFTYSISTDQSATTSIPIGMSLTRILLPIPKNLALTNDNAMD